MQAWDSVYHWCATSCYPIQLPRHTRTAGDTSQQPTAAAQIGEAAAIGFCFRSWFARCRQHWTKRVVKSRGVGGLPSAARTVAWRRACIWALEAAFSCSCTCSRSRRAPSSWNCTSCLSSACASRVCPCAADRDPPRPTGCLCGDFTVRRTPTQWHRRARCLMVIRYMWLFSSCLINTCLSSIDSVMQADADALLHPGAIGTCVRMRAGRGGGRGQWDSAHRNLCFELAFLDIQLVYSGLEFALLLLQLSTHVLVAQSPSSPCYTIPIALATHSHQSSPVLPAYGQS